MVDVSVVIPLYNKARYIRDTLHSVVNQSFRDIEIIVVDDGSTDGGDAVVEGVGDDRIRLIRQSNSGVSVARNTGINSARGGYVFFLDADDLWHKDHVQRMYTYLSASSEPMMICSAFIRSSNPMLAMNKMVDHLDDTNVVISDLATEWLSGNIFITSSVAVAKPILDRVKPCFVPGLSNGEDMDLWFRLADEVDCLFFKCPSVVYATDSDGSLSRSESNILLPPYISLLEQRLRGGLVSRNMSSVGVFVGHAYLSLARNLAAHSSRRLALGALSKAFPYDHQSKRFWFTLLLIAFAPRSFIASWEFSRKKRFHLV
jgi:glycosyltransferase involved in cell wall biosynthesis